MSDHALRHGVPGAALGLMTGSEIATATHGVTSLDTAEPVTDGTRFAVGSITKPVVATMLLDLADGGLIDLDSPMSEQLPELARSRWASTATPRAMLAGLSRIPLRSDWEFSLAHDSPHALAEITMMVSDAEPAAPVWSYSNLAFSVLGRLIEHVTGAAWEDATKLQLLDPYGMAATVCAVSGSEMSAASGHEVRPEGISVVERWVFRAYCSSGTSLFSSVGDLLTFARRHLDAPSLATLRIPQSSTSIHGWLDGWGLGWARFDWSGITVWGWDGVVPGQRGFIRLIPERDAAFVLLTNGSTGRAMYRSLIGELASDWMGTKVPELRLDPDEHAGSLDLDAYAGIYSWPDRSFEMSVDNGALVVASGDQRATAVPIDRRVFVIDRSNPDTPTMTFDAFDGDGRPHVVYRMLWGFPRH